MYSEFQANMSRKKKKFWKFQIKMLTTWSAFLSIFGHVEIVHSFNLFSKYHKNLICVVRMHYFFQLRKKKKLTKRLSSLSILMHVEILHSFTLFHATLPYNSRPSEFKANLLKENLLH